jgi:hypothetical protein
MLYNPRTSSGKGINIPKLLKYLSQRFSVRILDAIQQPIALIWCDARRIRGRLVSPRLYKQVCAATQFG